MIAAYLDLAGRALLATVLAAAAIGKGRSRATLAEFGASLKPLRITGRPATVLAVAVVVGEAAGAVLLLIPATVGFGYLVAIAMMVAFTVVVVSSVVRGTGMQCLCFGATPQTLGVRHIVRNVAVTTVGTAAAIAHLAPGGATGPGGTVAATGIAILAGLAVAAWDDLTSVFGVAR